MILITCTLQAKKSDVEKYRTFLIEENAKLIEIVSRRLQRPSHRTSFETIVISENDTRMSFNRHMLSIKIEFSEIGVVAVNADEIRDEIRFHTSGASKLDFSVWIPNSKATFTYAEHTIR